MVIRRVDVAADVYEQAHQQFDEERSIHGSGSEYDFVGGPLAAAILAFRDFDALGFDVVPAVRAYTVVDPIFGAVVFVAVLLDGEKVEIVSFAADPDYWAAVNDDPD
jgi:hypothetical protein